MPTMRVVAARNASCANGRLPARRGNASRHAAAEMRNAATPRASAAASGAKILHACRVGAASANGKSCGAVKVISALRLNAPRLLTRNLKTPFSELACHSASSPTPTGRRKVQDSVLIAAG